MPQFSSLEKQHSLRELEWMSERAQLVRALRKARRQNEAVKKTGSSSFVLLVLSLLLNLFAALGILAALLF